MKCKPNKVTLAMLVEDVDDAAFESNVLWSISFLGNEKYKYIIKFTSKEDRANSKYAAIDNELWNMFQESIDHYHGFVSYIQHQAKAVSQK